VLLKEKLSLGKNTFRERKRSERKKVLENAALLQRSPPTEEGREGLKLRT